MSITVMKQALEALEKSVGAMRGLYGGWRCEAPLKAADAAITSLRQAIAEAQKQEPMAWDCCANCGRPEHEHTDENCPKPFTTVWHAWDYEFPPDTHSKPKREWVGLTDEGMRDIEKQFNAERVRTPDEASTHFLRLANWHKTKSQNWHSNTATKKDVL
jgi:hypothetical protein